MSKPVADVLEMSDSSVIPANPQVPKAPWPKTIAYGFALHPNRPKVYGQRAWHTLLYNFLFHLDSPPGFMIGPSDAVPGKTTFTVCVAGCWKDVFAMEVRPSYDLADPSKRKEADASLRQQLSGLAEQLEIPVLYGLSAFGSKFAVYRYDKDADSIFPRNGITLDPVDDAPSCSWWSYDALEYEGAQKLRELASDVKRMWKEAGF